MIHFTDSSSLIKTYVGESGSPTMLALVLKERIGVSVLTFAEVHATFARRRRDGLCTAEEWDELDAAFLGDWEAFVHVQVDESTLTLVPQLCAKYPLRASDAVQLASAVVLRSRGVGVAFVCSDTRLKDAATGESFAVLDPVTATM